jgi:hypothetical protein
LISSIKGINKTNKRRKSGGYYAKPEAMEEAAYEAFEGKLSIEKLAAKLDRQQIIDRAIANGLHGLAHVEIPIPFSLLQSLFVGIVIFPTLNYCPHFILDIVLPHR